MSTSDLARRGTCQSPSGTGGNGGTRGSGLAGAAQSAASRDAQRGASGGGASAGAGGLPAGLRRTFESSLGVGLGDVRLHTDEGAAALSRGHAAKAFATGSDVYFGAGQYRPNDTAGQQMLAHEVAHVVQQRGSPGAAPQRMASTGYASGPAEVEADRAASAMLSGQRFEIRTSAPGVIARWLDEARAQQTREHIATAPIERLQGIINDLEVLQLRTGTGERDPVQVVFGRSSADGFSSTVLFGDLGDLRREARERLQNAQPGPHSRPGPAATPAPVMGRGPVRNATCPSDGLGQQVRETELRTQSGPAPAPQAGALDATARQVLDRLVTTVRADMRTWANWRDHAVGQRPGGDTLRGANDTHSYFASSGGLTRPMREYLTAQIGPGDRPYLVELIAMAPSGTTQTAEDVFGIPRQDAGHRYTVDVEPGHSGGGSIGPVGASVAYRTARIRYTNRFGMGFEHTIHNVSVAGSATVGESVGVGLERPEGGGRRQPVPQHERTGEGNRSAAGSHELGSSSGHTTVVPEFWETSWFEESNTARSITFGWGVSAGGATRGSSRNLLSEMEFHHGVRNLMFHMTTGADDQGHTNQTAGEILAGDNPAAQMGRPSLSAGLNAGLTAEVAQGRAVGTSSTTTNPAVQPPETRTPERSSLTTTSIQFDVESDTVTGASDRIIQRVVEVMRRYSTEHANPSFEVLLTGHSSPRWRSARTPEEAYQHNLELSDRRVAATEQQLQNARRAMAIPGSCDFRRQSCPPAPVESGPVPVYGQGVGSQTALDRGVPATAVDMAWQRVDICVMATVYYGPQGPRQAPTAAR